MNPTVDNQPSNPVPEQPTGPAFDQAVSPALGTTPDDASSEQPAAAADSGAAVPPTTGSPQVADDSDMIEKEWVVKAKEIIAATRQDPFAQNQQLAALKADYMQKRYNKTVKLGT